MPPPCKASALRRTVQLAMGRRCRQCTHESGLGLNTDEGLSSPVAGSLPSSLSFFWLVVGPMPAPGWIDRNLSSACTSQCTRTPTVSSPAPAALPASTRANHRPHCQLAVATLAMTQSQ
ncbi:hypothetical protein GUJ93_ZPchr0010g8895 [Zizania palustris]|uniref:Uncharacterized protein n=1 Tax=Zizania palustris TaxID=103762 RepID=A0A8J6BCC1_ZIZPA|nr:hypothetical protein GUJ93_ZPchr0010g8895 [Zizania palustris]